MKKTYTITSETFAKIFGTQEKNLPEFIKDAIKKADFRYEKVEGKELEEAILRIIKTLDSKDIKIAGSHRQIDWEKGWKENLRAFKKNDYDLQQLVPKFVKKKEIIRFQGNFIFPKSKLFETDFVTILRYYLFSKYYKGVETLYEFGAGTGLNLVAAAEILPNIKLVGLDWANATIDIINALKKKLGINISAKKFNLFKPDKSYFLNKDSAILTVGTLEQLGKNFEPFISYLLENKPKICLHMETLDELYDQDNLLDYLAVKYLEKRNYLQGFLPYLKKLEKENKVKIMEIRRTFGSFYHEGYTYIVWRPI